MRLFGWQLPPTDEFMTRPMVVVTPEPDPVYDDVVRKTAETLGRLQRMGHELPAISQQIRRGRERERAAE